MFRFYVARRFWEGDFDEAHWALWLETAKLHIDRQQNKPELAA